MEMSAVKSVDDRDNGETREKSPFESSVSLNMYILNSCHCKPVEEYWSTVPISIDNC